MSRLFSRRQRLILAFLSGGRCKGCGQRLPRNFHADHVWPFTLKGPTTIRNGQALCPTCNIKKGCKVAGKLKLRDWQESALQKALGWLVDGKDRHFLINAAPGSGKTRAACAIAAALFEIDQIDRVVVIAPRVGVVNQWADEFRFVTDRKMSRVTGADDDDDLEIDVCATWNAVESLADMFHAACSKQRVLVICDEHHHAAVEAAWGNSADDAFAKAKYVLILTGTPIRSDGKNSIWLSKTGGTIDHPEEGSYTLTYGQAVDLKYCRPATFHRHEGRFTVDLQGGETLQVSSKEPPKLDASLKKIEGIQRALDFYVLACAPQYENDKVTPKVDGYQGSMVEYASAKLDDLRCRMPNAAGLVIAPSIEMAEYFVDLIEQIEGERPEIVHNQMKNAENRIDKFRQTLKRWIVSVAMVSEGVDIPRLRVLIYLSKAQTELAFRQALGRVVRSAGEDDDTRAYVVMPSFQIFEEHARRVEEEMSEEARKEKSAPTTKKCPVCTSEVPRGSAVCDVCGHEFPKAPPRFKTCVKCQGLNPISAKECQHCGAKFGSDFVITLNEALRVGAIVRGVDVEEGEVRDGEVMADGFRDFVMRTGDAKMLNLAKMIPDELLGRFANFIDAARKSKESS